MYRLEDINEIVTSYGNHFLGLHNKVSSAIIAKYIILYPNGWTDWTEIWNQDFLVDDTSFE